MPTSRKRIAKKRINKYSEPSVLQFAPPQNFNITSHLTFGAIVALKQDLIFSTEVKAVAKADLLLCSSLILPLLPTRSHILAQGQRCGILFFPQVEAVTESCIIMFLMRRLIQSVEDPSLHLVAITMRIQIVIISLIIFF